MSPHRISDNDWKDGNTVPIGRILSRVLSDYVQKLTYLEHRVTYIGVRIPQAIRFPIKNPVIGTLIYRALCASFEDIVRHGGADVRLLVDINDDLTVLTVDIISDTPSGDLVTSRSLGQLKEELRHATGDITVHNVDEGTLVRLTLSL